MGFKKFTDLEVYKKSRIFRKDISNIVKKYFPKEEKFNLTSQIIRSSRSVTANLAEGHGRFYYQDNIRFCRIARGSLEETLEHLITAFDENYIDLKLLKLKNEQQKECLRLINGYIRFLRTSKAGKSEFET